MPVESTLSTKELRKTWTGKSSRAKATIRKPKKRTGFNPKGNWAASGASA
eukprot:COSAG02_NODE_14132_length_1306_cov_1.855841_1_plen_49_part_10